MVRGLIRKWKQPVYFDFDQDMIKEILLRCILAIENAGYLVYTITSDLGGENRSLWNSLNITMNNTSFVNPADETRKIYVFSDVPHNMKNLRNHIIDDGIILEDGSLLDLGVLEHMESNNGNEIKLCPKLCQKLLHLKGSERMRVAPAVQLLSGHMAALAKHLYPEKPCIREFFETINNGFDVLNSRVPVDKTNPCKSGYGFSFERQKVALIKLKTLLETVRFRTKKRKSAKKSLLPFQVGFIISITSLMDLYDDLHAKYRIRYILTSRLTQDCLESLFAVVRSFSGLYVNPTPSEFRYRLRLILLGCRIRPPKNTNTLFDENNVAFVTSSLIQKNEIDHKIQETVQTENCEDASEVNEQKHFDELHDTAGEGVRYIAGYLAWKLKRLGLGLYGYPTNALQVRNSNSVDTSWIELLSRGGLLIPDQNFLEMVRTIENLFGQFFTEFQYEQNISTKLVNRISQIHPDYDPVVLKYFMNTRLRIKIKSLNQNRIEVINRKRKAKQFSAGTPLVKRNCKLPSS